MLTVAFVICAVGLITSFGSFVFAALNMGRSVSSDSYSFEDAFRRHVGAMVGVALGGLCLALGVLIALATIGNSLLTTP